MTDSDRQLKTREFFLQLDSSDIVYCHWKSNEHLIAGLEGETDMDVLIDVHDYPKVRQILIESGWIKVVSRPSIKGIEDWLHEDVSETRLYHLHLHTHIPIGGSTKKAYSCVDEHSILKSRLRKNNAWVSHPYHERSLLMLRILLKTNLRNILKYLIKRHSLFPHNIVKEIDWLKQQKIEDTTACLPGSLQKISNQVWSICGHQKLSVFFLVYKIVQLRLLLLPYLTGRILLPRKTKGKLLSSAGIVIALIGVDGSGKSSVVSEISTYYGRKFAIVSLYAGQPKKRGFGKIFFQTKRYIPWGQVIFHIYVAWYRKKTIQQAHSLALSGHVVFVDRYPLPDLWTESRTIDGPRIKKGWLGKLERILYMNLQRPDICLYLRADIDTLRQRDATITDKARQEKFVIMESLQAHYTIRTVDATQSLSNVVKQVRNIFWEQVCKL